MASSILKDPQFQFETQMSSNNSVFNVLNDERARNNSKKFPKYSQTSFSGIVNLATISKNPRGMHSLIMGKITTVITTEGLT